MRRVICHMFYFYTHFHERKVNKMQFCKDCYVPMIGVMSFSKDKHERFCRCPKCYEETKHKKLRDDELDFGETLDKEIHKRK